MTSKQENIFSFPDLKGIEEQAALWVARMDSRDLSPAEQKELVAWLKQGPQHREALERLSALWGGSDILDELNYIDDAEKSSWGLGSWQLPRWKVMSIAATYLLVFAAAIWFTTSTPDTQKATFATPVGGQERVELVDGSTLQLNTDTELTINITEDERKIRLLRGEAHFSVAHDPERPFLVYAGEGAVKAVGTAFTVHLREKAVEVTVAEGVVELLSSREKTQVTVAATNDGIVPPVLTSIAALTVGQNAVFSQKVDRLDKMSEKELERKLLWREGFVAFAGEPLSSVVADISRYTDIMIEIQDPALEKTPIGGYFQVGDVDGMFEALENVFGLQVDKLGEHHVVLKRAS